MATETPSQQKVVVKEMSWDPITRIVGSLGIHTEIDFTNQEVLKCYSTSMIFRGFDIFMTGIDPRDAHFITSRICGICGDNHCTCSCLNQNMAYGVKPPKLGDLAFNLAETADYIFDTRSSTTAWPTSTSASRWSRRPTPACWPRPKAPRRPTTTSMAPKRSTTSSARSIRSPS